MAQISLPAEIGLRFIGGGLVVSFFAILSDILYPKVFAGLLGAAPSVALASLALTARYHGPSEASLDARSMILGAAAFFVYAWAVRASIARSGRSTRMVASSSLAIWLGVALGLKALVFR